LLISLQAFLQVEIEVKIEAMNQSQQATKNFQVNIYKWETWNDMSCLAMQVKQLTTEKSKSLLCTLVSATSFMPPSNGFSHLQPQKLHPTNDHSTLVWQTSICSLVKEIIFWYVRSGISFLIRIKFHINNLYTKSSFMKLRTCTIIMVVISSKKVERLRIQKGRCKGRSSRREKIHLEIWHALIVTMYVLLLEWSLLI